MAAVFQKIVIQSVGTRGDCQPMVAIALKLQEEGYDVTVFAPEDSSAFVESVGVKCRAVFCDIQHEMTQGKAKAAMETGDANIFIEALGEINQKNAAVTVQRWHEAMIEIKPDLCISGTLCDTFGMVMARHFKIPVITVGLQPIPENPPRMIMGLPNLPCCGLNKRLVKLLMHGAAQGELDTFGVELKKQVNIDWKQLMTLQQICDTRNHPAPARRVLLGFDPLMGNMLYGGEKFVPPNMKLLGFFAVTADQQLNVAKQGQFQKQKSNQFGGNEELEELASFCSNGEAPAYLGFGSMTARTPEYMVRLLCMAAKRAKTRAIVCKGWAKLSMELLQIASKDPALIEYAKENILFVGNTPHEWLFPKCSCIVHHGGAGTTSTASRSGIPQIITPVWMDQWDTAHFLNDYGSGIGFKKQLLDIGPFELGDAIRKVQSDDIIKAKARQWQEEAFKQQGATDFVKELKAWWEFEVVTGNWERYNEDEMKEVLKK